MNLTAYQHYGSKKTARIDLNQRLLTFCLRYLKAETKPDPEYILPLLKLVAVVNAQRAIEALDMVTGYLPEHNLIYLEWLIICLLATTEVEPDTKLRCLRVIDRYHAVSLYLPAARLAREIGYFRPESWKLIMQCARDHHVEPKST